MSVTISPVRTASDLTRFIKMVWPIYKNDPECVRLRDIRESRRHNSNNP